MLPFEACLDASGVELKLGVVLGGTGNVGSYRGVEAVGIDQLSSHSGPFHLYTHIARNIVACRGTTVADLSTTMTVHLFCRELLRRGIRQCGQSSLGARGSRSNRALP